jgi:hypothetical protein
MDYAKIHERYLEIRKIRLQVLTEHGGLAADDAEAFEALEGRMCSGDLGADWMRAFQLSNDVYVRLLNKVLKAAVEVHEPWAAQKLAAFVAELGIASPMAYLSPWDLTLAELDGHYGQFEQVAAFYGVQAVAA